MRSLPLADPGTPDVRSPGRYLWWVARGQLPTIIGGITFGTIWMVAQSVMPAIIGKAIDAGVADQNMSQLWLWALALLGVGVVQAAAGIVRHRFAVQNWLIAAYRTVQLVARVVNRGGMLKPGMSGNVAVTLAERENALVVPDEAVFAEGAQSFVFKVNPDSTVSRTAISLGIRDSSRVEVVHGLEPGVRVVRSTPAS